MSESYDWALGTLRQEMKWLEEVDKVLSIHQQNHQRSPFQQLVWSSCLSKAGFFKALAFDI